MAYTPRVWKDRVVEKPRTYQMQDNGDGTFTLIPAPGTVHEPGTPVIAAYMNQIEQGIAAALPKSGGTMTGPLVNSVTLAGVNKTIQTWQATDGKTYQLVLRVDGSVSIYNVTDGVTVIRFGPGNGEVVQGNGYKFWHEGNDGAGSGLAADTVPGYGIGVNVPYVSDLNALPINSATGFYRSSGATLNRPSSVTSGDGSVLHIGRDSRPSQVFFDYNTGDVYHRGYTAAGWQPWRKMWHDNMLRWNSDHLEYNDNGTWKAVGGVKNVQYGQATVTNPGGAGSTFTTNVTISAVDRSKAIVVLGGFTTASPVNSPDAKVKARLTSATNLEITCNFGGSSADSVDVPWQVAEYL